MLVFESIAFGISLLAFIFGLFKINFKNAPFYFKMLTVAVGCYSLEELWIIVDAVCGIHSSTFSVRLIGVFGCFCAFLTANSKGLDKVIGDGIAISKRVKAFSMLVPVILFAIICSYLIINASILKSSHLIIIFIVFIPAIIDSYFECMHILMPTDKLGLLKYIKMINAFILIEYAISFAYLYVSALPVILVMDVVSAIVLAMVVVLSERGAKQWLTLT